MDDEQTQLHALWHKARAGNLTPWSEVKARALREVWRDTLQKKDDSDYGLLPYAAARLKKKGPKGQWQCLLVSWQGRVVGVSRMLRSCLG